MNTNTTNFLLSKEQFQAVQIAFKAYFHKQPIKASDIVVYNYLRTKDLGAGFTPITNANRLKNNGNNKWQGLESALSNAAMMLKYEPTHAKEVFGDTITPELMASAQVAIKAKLSELSTIHRTDIVHAAHVAKGA